MLMTLNQEMKLIKKNMKLLNKRNDSIENKKVLTIKFEELEDMTKGIKKVFILENVSL